MPNIRNIYIGSGTGIFDYASIAACAAARSGTNLVTDDVIEVWNCYEGNTEAPASTITLALTTDSDRYLKIQSYRRKAGKIYNTPSYTMVVDSLSPMVTVNTKNVVIEDMEFTFEANNGTAFKMANTLTGFDFLMNRCFMAGGPGAEGSLMLHTVGSGVAKIANSFLAAGVTLSASGNFALYNNHIWAYDNFAVTKNTNNTTEYFKNNLIVDLLQTGPTFFASGNGASYSSSDTRNDYNFSNMTIPVKGTHGGVWDASTVLASITGLLTSGLDVANGAMNSGVNLTSDSILPFNRDMNDCLRSVAGAWTIGPVEYVPSIGSNTVKAKANADTKKVVQAYSTMANEKPRISNSIPVRKVSDTVVKQAKSGDILQNTKNIIGYNINQGGKQSHFRYVSAIRTTKVNTATQNQDGEFINSPTTVSSGIAMNGTPYVYGRATPGKLAFSTGAGIPTSQSYPTKTV